MKYSVVKIGGSILSTKEDIVNTRIILPFVKIISKFLTENQDNRLILVVGGGYLSRFYRDAVKRLGEKEESDMHMVGMNATWLNAELLRAILSPYSYPTSLGVGVYSGEKGSDLSMIEKEFEDWLRSDKQLIISGGFIKGTSTDYNAMVLAAKLGVEKVYKLTDVDYVYSVDPDKDPNAQKFESLSWSEYLNLFDVNLDNLQHKPGAHMPIDALAATVGISNGITVNLAKGLDAENLNLALLDKDLEGTIISG